MRLFGCALTAPEKVTDFLSQRGLAYDLVGLGRKIKNTDHDYILCLSFADFKNNLEVFNSREFKYKNVVVFTSILKLRMIHPVFLLDVKSLTPDLTNPFDFTTPNLEVLCASSSEIQPHKSQLIEDDYLGQLIEDSSKGSILTSLMTLIYRIPTSKSQNECRDRIILWLYQDNKTLQDLERDLDWVRPLEVRSQLLEIVSQYHNYKKFFKSYRKLENKEQINQESIEKAIKEFGVNEFDIHYMLSILSKIRENQKLKAS